MPSLIAADDSASPVAGNGHRPRGEGAIAPAAPADGRSRRVRVLDVDPELGYRLDDGSRARARQEVLAELRVLEVGHWRPHEDGLETPGNLGLLIVGGVVVRRVSTTSSVAGEILGPGDLVRPWQEDVGFIGTTSEVVWQTLRPTRIAILDADTTAAACRFPGLVETILARAVERSRNLAFHMAVTHLKRVDVRVLLLLWFLADRWGRVTPEGITIPLTLTHQLLADLIGAQRPSVTMALSELVRSGLLTRRPDGSWLLPPEPPDDLPLGNRVDTAVVG